MKTTHTQTIPEELAKIEVKTEEKDIVCVKDSTPLKNENIQTSKTDGVKDLQKAIKKVTDYQVPIKKIRKLLASSSLKRIQFHLKHWNIHKAHQKSEGAGWFFTVVEHDITPERRIIGRTGEEKGKIPQRDNFDQREYSREYLGSFYADLSDVTEYKHDTASDPEKERPYTYIEQ